MCACSYVCVVGVGRGLYDGENPSFSRGGLIRQCPGNMYLLLFLMWLQICSIRQKTTEVAVECLSLDLWRQTDMQTDGQTDMQTDRKRERGRCSTLPAIFLCTRKFHRLAGHKLAQPIYFNVLRLHSSNECFQKNVT